MRGPDPAFVDTLADAVVVTDPRLGVLQWNRAMERLTGRSRARALGRPLRGLVPMLDAIGLPRHLELALGGEVRFTAEVPAPAPAPGPGVWVEGRCAPLRSRSGRVTGAVAFLTDVTERRRRSLFVGAMEAIGRSLTSSLDLDEVLDTIVGKAREVMAADSALVVSWDGAGSVLRVLRAAGRLSREYAAAGEIPVGGGPVSLAVLQARPMTTSNILNDPRVWLPPERRAQIEREGFKAAAAAPLVAKGRVHGALVVHYWTERTFADEEVMTLALLAEQAAIAIDNARLYAEATRRADRLRELAEVEGLIAASLDLDRVLRAIAEATARLVEAPVVHLWTADRGARLLRLRAWSVSPDTPAAETRPTMPFGEGITGLAAERGTPVFVADAAGDPRVRNRAWTEAGLVAILAVPILSGDRLLGVLTVRAAQGRLSAPEDQALVMSFAARAALAIENARTYADALRRAARLRELAAVSQSITASLETADVMQRIADAAAAMTPGALAAVHVIDDERAELRLMAAAGAGWEGLPRAIPWNAGLPGLVAEQRSPVLVAEPAAHPRTLVPAWWRARPGASYYGVPVFAGETLVGVLDYVFPEGTPAEEDQEAVRLLAAHAGIAIRNAMLYQAERMQAERLGALAAINQRISSSLDLDDLLRLIAESAASLTGVRYASFWVADEERRTLTLKGASAPGIAEAFPQPVMEYGAGGVGWIARHRKPLVIDDVFADERVLNLSWWKSLQLRTFAGYPVMAGDELLAVLVLSDAAPIRMGQEGRDLIDMFIAQASVAIRNARLYRDAQRRRDVAEALARVAREITGSLDLERIAALVARGVVELLDGRASAVYRYEPADGSLQVMGSFGEAATVKAGEILQPGEGTVGRAVAGRRVVATEDLLSDPDVLLSERLRERVLASGQRAVVAVPLTVQERIVGALAVTGDQGRRFTAEQLRVLQAFADQAALMIENARLYAASQDSLARLHETQAQLVQAAKMSAIGQLVSGVAHELNNPLSVIIGYGQLLLGRDTPPALRRPLELIVAQGDRMAKIVRNLLYFSRQRPPERAPVDLNHVIEQTLALRINQLTLAGIAVECDLDAALPRVSADAQQLQQVFLNLLLNAEQAITGERRVEPAAAAGGEGAGDGRRAQAADAPAGRGIDGRPGAERAPDRPAVTAGGPDGPGSSGDVARPRAGSAEASVAPAPFAGGRGGVRVEAEPVGGRAGPPAILGPPSWIASPDAARARPGRIVFRTRAIDGGQAVRAEVVDDGPGIPPDVLPRIFEPFFTTKEVGVGTGLGLSVSYGIVEEHGGRLSVESEPGRTVFALELPVNAPAGLAVPASAPHPPPLRGDGRLALVVEDEAGVADLVVGLLRETGWQVDVATGGRAGLGLVRERRYDLVVSDVRMPEGGGDAFFRDAIVQDPSLARRFLFITGDTANVEALQFLQRAKVPVLEKPFTPDRFLEVVRRVAMGLPVPLAGQ